jgi:DNA (cytosine-5)-methyltransferase 1
VFIVGHLGSVERAARALFEPVGLSWDPSPRQETRAKPAAPLTAGSASGRGVNRPGRRREDDENLAIVNTLDRHMGGLDDNAAQAGHIVFQNAGGSCWREGQPTLATSDDNGTNQVVTESYVTHTLRAEGHDASEDGTGRGVPLIGVQSSQSGVRRLTPRECERLQGFPDDWTRWDDSGKELSDSARYRMLGNAVARPVAEWIGRRILASATP